jgi:hypothetical protein
MQSSMIWRRRHPRVETLVSTIKEFARYAAGRPFFT